MDATTEFTLVTYKKAVTIKNELGVRFQLSREDQQYVGTMEQASTAMWFIVQHPDFTHGVLYDAGEKVKVYYKTEDGEIRVDDFT